MVSDLKTQMPRGGMIRRAAFAVLVLWAPRASAETFPLSDGQMLVGTPGFYIAGTDDTLLDIARDNDLGYGQLMSANNDLDPWRPGEGHGVVLPNVYLLPPGPRKGIVIDLAAQRLYYFPAGSQSVESYPIGAGAEAGMTPRGTTKVVGKVVKPVWYVPKSIRKEQPDLPGMVPAGPDNPLGEYAFRLGWPSYLIHGTNKPYGVGRNVSHGCIHLYPEDIEKLFHEVPIGTPVRVVDDEIRLGWIGGELYLGISPSHAQIDEISINRPMTPSVPKNLFARVTAAAGDQVNRVDWRAVAEIGLRRPGLPVAITEAASGDTASDASGDAASDADSGQLSATGDAQTGQASGEAQSGQDSAAAESAP